MIIVQLLGGLGNQMFQYAIGKKLALLNNCELKLDVSILHNRRPFKAGFAFRSYDLDLFNIKADIATAEDIPLYPSHLKINSIPHRLWNLYQIRRRGYKYILEWKPNPYNTLLYNDNVLKKRGNLYLAGYWVSPKYFQGIEDILRNDFTFKVGLPAKCEDIRDKIVSSNSICVTIRRTDFLVVKAMGVHGVEYISKAVSFIAEKIPNPVFFIFSDDMDWCKANIKMEYPYFFVEEEYYGERFKEKLHLMSLCKHFINANSNFAWWAAWLSENKNKIVVVPKNYYHDRDARDLIPDDWTLV
jgi:hypothetical protein